MVNHVTEVNVAVLWGEHRAVGKQESGWFREAYPLRFYKRGLSYEILSEHFEAARVCASINRVFSGIHIVWVSRMVVPWSGVLVGPTEKY